MTRHRTTLMLLAGTWVLVACAHSGGATAALPPASPSTSSVVITTTVATTVVITTPITTAITTAITAPITTAAPSTTVAPRLQLSADGPWRRVDSAPGITTPGLFYELMPKLWAYLPLEMDLEHGIAWTLHNPDDIPVIEGYLRAQMTFVSATTQRPMDLRASTWSATFDDPATIAWLEAAQRDAANLDLDLGVVLRPEVIGDERTESTAFIYDCTLDGSVFRNADGSVAPGSHHRIALSGTGFRLRVADGRWKVVQMGDQPEACW